MKTNKGFKVNAGESRLGKHFKMKGITSNTIDVKISGADTEGNIAVFEITGIEPYGGPPLHLHPSQDEWIYVVEGEYLIQVGEDKHQMKTGDTIFLPRNVKHAFMQLTEKGKMVASFFPAGKMQAFFNATDQWTSPPTEEEIVRVFEVSDMKVVGAPLKFDKV
jgi:quercetin dioxygenase-like cupin family protein